MQQNGPVFVWVRSSRWLVFMALMAMGILLMGMDVAHAAPKLDKTKYHSWKEVNRYLKAVARDPHLRHIVKLIPIGRTREGKPLRVLRISRKGIWGSHPEAKPATFIVGAHHAREHVSKETVLALIDALINGYGKKDARGRAITYLVDAGTFYLLPWVNPDGGMNEYLHNPEQRKTNAPADSPQIGAADCDTCGDGIEDEDSPSIVSGDVGVTSESGFDILFPENRIIGRALQLWYENDVYDAPVLDERVGRVQPGFSAYTFNYEGVDPDNDGLYGPYSGEDWVGGVDPNRNYGEPLWGDCANDEGCSWLAGAQTYAGPEPFSEPETAAVAAFMRAHPNIVTMESLHSGVNEIYPPWFVYPDAVDKSTMDASYQDAVAQYISQETGYEVFYGGQYAVKGDTTGYSYIGSSQDPALGLAFFPGGFLSFTTEVYGMGSDSGSAEAIKDWFPEHYTQFDTNYPQGIFITWSDFPLCTTCGPETAQGPLPWYNYTQYLEYFIFNSPVEDDCGGADTPGMFHCEYHGVADSGDYYADLDIFAYFNPPAANRCYEDWNCDGSALVRTVDLNLKHLMYRLYIAPYIQVNDAQTSYDGQSLDIAIENIGFLRSSVMTVARQGEDPLVDRFYDMGRVDVKVFYTLGFNLKGPRTANIGWLGGGRADDPEPRVKSARFDVSGLSHGDLFMVCAGSEKTGRIFSLIRALRDRKSGAFAFKTVWTSAVKRPEEVVTYFDGSPTLTARKAGTMMRATNQIENDMWNAAQRRLEWKRLEGPFDVQPGLTKGIILRKYHD